ncbi:DUF721 domain-containing protein [Marinilabiliaceae bacterium ANBcel2]|nr:DUF721 domain-containing protein [Marinilabiliaceae bacterium ANBcel2]
MKYHGKKRYGRDYNSRSLADILSEIVEKPQLKKGYNQTKILKLWPEVMGSSVSRITKNLYIKNGVLYVYLNSSVIRNELLMHKNKIIESLNEKVGGRVINDIVIR